MAHGNLLIICTDDQQPGGILDAARQLAAQERLDLRLLCVVSTDKMYNKAMSAQLDRIFEHSKQSGAEMIVYFSDEKSDIVCSYISKNNVEEVLTTAREYNLMQGIIDQAGLDVKVRAAGSI